MLSLVNFFQCTFIAGFWNNFQDHIQVLKTFRNTGSYQKAGTSALKRVTLLEGKASRNFYLDFLHIKTTKNCETIGDISISRTLKKYSSPNTVPLINRKNRTTRKGGNEKTKIKNYFALYVYVFFDVKIVEEKKKTCKETFPWECSYM